MADVEISSDSLTPAELYNLAYMRIRPLLVTVPGIVLPHLYGGQDMQVMVNRSAEVNARRLTPADIHASLMKQYLVLPSGDIKIKSTDWIVQRMPPRCRSTTSATFRSSGKATRSSTCAMWPR